jgi:serine O-acetyltransferase
MGDHVSRTPRPVRDALRADLESMVPREGSSAPRWRLEVAVKLLLFPRVRAIAYYRIGQVLAGWGLLPLAYWLENRAIRGSGAEISPLAQIGPGIALQHSVGVVIGPQVRIGARVMIYQGVTLGDGTEPGQPTLGDDVVLGSGACVLGGIRVGDRVEVGAQAVVTKDLPDDVVAVGIPATYRPRRTAQNSRR